MYCSIGLTGDMRVSGRGGAVGNSTHTGVPSRNIGQNFWGCGGDGGGDGGGKGGGEGGEGGGALVITSAGRVMSVRFLSPADTKSVIALEGSQFVKTEDTVTVSAIVVSAITKSTEMESDAPSSTRSRSNRRTEISVTLSIVIAPGEMLQTVAVPLINAARSVIPNSAAVYPVRPIETSTDA